MQHRARTIYMQAHGISSALTSLRSDSKITLTQDGAGVGLGGVGVVAIRQLGPSHESCRPSITICTIFPPSTQQDLPTCIMKCLTSLLSVLPLLTSVLAQQQTEDWSSICCDNCQSLYEECVVECIPTAPGPAEQYCRSFYCDSYRVSYLSDCTRAWLTIRQGECPAMCWKCS